MKHLIWVLISAASISCVSTHTNPEQNSPISGISTSCSINPSIDIPEYKGVLCTFENKLDRTVQFKLADIDFDNDSYVVTRREARDVMSAWKEKQQQNLHNRKMGTLAAIGIGFVAILSGEPALMDAGSLAIAGASSYDSSMDISEAHARNQYGDSNVYSFGDTLIDENITVPGQLFVRKGFLVKLEGSPSHVNLCFNQVENCQSFTL